MGWLIALAILVLLAVCPLGISAKYDEAGALVKVIAGPVRLRLYPTKKQTAKKSKKEENEPESPGKKPAQAASEKKKGGSVTDFMPLIRIALDFLGDFRRRLRGNRLEMKIILAGDEPCDLAVNYGRACGALAGLEPQLERLFVIRKKDLQVECDFTEDKTLIWARIDLTITLGRLLALAARYGYLAVREFLKIKQLRKGGALK